MLLHDIEIASSLALYRNNTFPYPAEKLQELWRFKHNLYWTKHCESLCLQVENVLLISHLQAASTKPVSRRDSWQLYRDGGGGCSEIL